MKKSKKVILVAICTVFIIVAILTFISLNNSKSTNNNTSIPGERILFQISHTNASTVYFHTDTFIDSDGTVRYYEISGKHESWNITYDERSIEKSHYRKAQLVKRLSKDDAIKFYKIAEQEKNNIRMTTPENGLFDSGETFVFLWYWDNLNKKYEMINIEETGELVSYSQNNNIKEVIEWLKKEVLYTPNVLNWK